MLAMDGRPGNGGPGRPGNGGPGDGGLGSPGDHNGRSGARMAGDGGPGNPSDDNGRSVALSEGGGEFRVAGGKVTGSEFHASAARAGDTGPPAAQIKIEMPRETDLFLLFAVGLRPQPPVSRAA